MYSLILFFILFINCYQVSHFGQITNHCLLEDRKHLVPCLDSSSNYLSSSHLYYDLSSAHLRYQYSRLASPMRLKSEPLFAEIWLAVFKTKTVLVKYEKYGTLSICDYGVKQRQPHLKRIDWYKQTKAEADCYILMNGAGWVKIGSGNCLMVSKQSYLWGGLLSDISSVLWS